MSQRRSHNHPNSLKNLDEILANISKLQNPTSILHDLATPELPTTGNKNSDILYLTIGIISGILLILCIILVVMCILRILQQRKFKGKFTFYLYYEFLYKNFHWNLSCYYDKKSNRFYLILAHVKSVNGSEYYCDGLHKTINPDYATTPCLQHGVVAVDGKLIPFTYPTNPKQPLLWNGQNQLPHSTTTVTSTENGTMRLSANPMNRVDNENINEAQENFYHTLTPFNPHSPYEEHSCPHNQSSMLEKNEINCFF